jgi:hypothetical protein
LVALLGLAIAGCGTDFGENDKASVFMRITSVLGSRGTEQSSSTFGSTLQSDVITMVGAGTDRQPTVFNDLAQLTIEVAPKNPNLVTSGTSARFNDVILERYEVHYLRSDGRNVEGVDVPFHITGPMAMTVVVRGSAAAVIEVVRTAAKLEPPLKNIAGGTGEDSIVCIAEITVHGKTMSGQVVSDTGRLQITFANWGDPS